MKRISMLILSCFIAPFISGCMATLNQNTVREVPPGIYTVTIVKADYEHLNVYGDNFIVLFDVKDEKELKLQYAGLKQDSRDVERDDIDDIDVRGLTMVRITDDGGYIVGYVGVASGLRVTIFENGSVVVGDAVGGGGDGGGGGCGC